MGLRKFATIAALLGTLYSSACSSGSSSISNLDGLNVDALNEGQTEISFTESHPEKYSEIDEEKFQDFFKESEQPPYDGTDSVEKPPFELEAEEVKPENFELPLEVIEEVAPDVIPDLSQEVDSDGLIEVQDDVLSESDSFVDEEVLEILNETVCSTPKQFYLDNDSDGYGDPNKNISACVQPEGYVDNNLDCNDDNENVNPDMQEICNFIDDNCNNLIDEGLATSTYYIDNDKDGYGGTAFNFCKNPDLNIYITLGGDCNDSDFNIHPGAFEFCNGKDDNCNGLTDEGGDALCDNGVLCDGKETCTNGSCKSGTVVDCSGNNLGAVDTCTYTPDGNSKTRDKFGGFTSKCSEFTGLCDAGTIVLTHTCDVADCGAECDSTNTCADTKCDTLEGCVGNDFHKYADVDNTCKDDCTCTDNVCSAPIVTKNDPRCTPCQTDVDCKALDKNYCAGDLVKQDTGKCIDYNCVAQTTTTQDCNVLDANKCVGTQVKHDNYTCTNATCALIETTLVQDCNDGAPCNGQEVCLNATCVPGTVVDCSGNNLAPVDTCTYTPDGNSKTQDSFDGFISTCDDLVGLCTTDTVTLSHTCDVNGCGAECDSTNACADTKCDTLDGCVGKDYHAYADVDNTCKDDCTCTDNVCSAPTVSKNDPRCTPCQTDDQCNSLTADHCDGDKVVHDQGRCIDYNCVIETTTTTDCNLLDGNKCVGTTIQRDDYTCMSATCTLAGTTLVQECNDGAYCNGQETCTNATCVPGTEVSCSSKDLPTINTCTYTPDGNSKTKDVFGGFTSVCDEGNDRCTTSTLNLTHTCDVAGCGAGCDATNTCASTECDTLDGCVGKDFYNYADLANNCNTDCICTTNVCANPTIIYNDPRCTECQTDDQCVSRNRDYCDGALVKKDLGKCADFSCTTQTTVIQDCDSLDTTLCVGTKVKFEDYGCVNGPQCSIINITQIQECNDGAYCNGQETCTNATCLSGTAVDCSANNLSPINTCTYTPDGNSKTRDTFAGYTSTCDEVNDKCNLGTVVLTHYCDVTCGAEWDSTHACGYTNCDSNDGCYSGTYRDYFSVPKVPQPDCSCANGTCNNNYVERVTDHDGDGYDVECDGDCNDDKANIHPNAQEICDGLDNDCNPFTLDGEGETAPFNIHQLGVCLNSRQSCISGGWQEDLSSIPGYNATEICDGLDNNCNGSADEGLEFRTYYPDTDKDGYGTLPGVSSCKDLVDHVLISGDCNDNDANVKPSAVEICNNVDDNCDNQIDEDLFRFVSCGFNMRGLQEQYCNYGSWDNGTFPCDDPDECVMNTSELRTCSSNVGECKIGQETYSCDLDLVSGNYKWFALGDCESTGVPSKVAGVLPKPEAVGTCVAVDLDGKDNDCNGVVDDGLCMVNVPAGEFKQGCESTYQTCNSLVSDDVPAHNVNLDSYNIDMYEVSNGQYKQCVIKGGCSEPSDKSSLTKPDYYDAYLNYPVMSVTWQQAKDYCTWAGKDLPTEAQWEKAAKGASPSHNTYPWGTLPLPTCTFVNYNISCVGDTWPVDNVPGTPQNISLSGAVNMSGNVSEFVNDFYSPTYYSEAQYQNPTGPISGVERVTRGGFYSTTIPNKLKLTTYGRLSALESFKGRGYGFRCKK